MYMLHRPDDAGDELHSVFVARVHELHSDCANFVVEDLMRMRGRRWLRKTAWRTTGSQALHARSMCGRDGRPSVGSLVGKTNTGHA